MYLASSGDKWATANLSSDSPLASQRHRACVRVCVTCTPDVPHVGRCGVKVHGSSGCSGTRSLSIVLSICVYGRVCVYMCVCICVCVCVRVSVCISVCAHMCVFICALACTPAAHAAHIEFPPPAAHGVSTQQCFPGTRCTALVSMETRTNTRPRSSSKETQ